GTIRCSMNQLPHLLDHRRAAVGREPHDLVLVLVDSEAEVRGERRVEHSKGMWIPDLTKQPDLRAALVATLAMSDSQGRPLAHAVGGENGGAFVRRREERGCRMCRVMRCKEYF